MFDLSLTFVSTDYTSATTARYLYVLKCLQFLILAQGIAGTITPKTPKELPSGELYMIKTPPSGTNPVIHTLKACKTACSES